MTPAMTSLKTGDLILMRSADNQLQVGARIGRGGQGTVYRTEINGRQMAVKWYPLSNNRLFDEKMRANLTKLVSDGRPASAAFIWPIDMVSSPGREGFGYIMPMVESRFITCFQMISDTATETPHFDIMIKIGLNLSDAFASLHGKGLCYRDISFGNLYVDPKTGDVAIIDNDNVGMTGGEAFVRGTPDFMAPEVMLDEASPGTESDLYSLALFLFYLFCHGHPLKGQAVENSYNSQERDELTDDELILKHFGHRPVFVFDPGDSSNRPVPGDPIEAWWKIYPRFFQDLFIRSFTTGLKEATLLGRLTEGVWRKALYRLSDCVWECDNAACQAGLLFDASDLHKACWRCGQVPEAPLLLTTPNTELVLWHGAVLTGRQLLLPGRQDEAIAEASLDSRFPGAVLLRNLTDQAWEVRVAGEEPKQVRPGQRLLARPMKLTIAGKPAAIVRAGTKEAA
jgi:DNA-binding helix-hairpin-helix protein with protein kinase domain